MTNTINIFIFDNKIDRRIEKLVLCFYFHTKHVKHHLKSNSKYNNVLRNSSTPKRCENKNNVTSSLSYRHVLARDMRYLQHGKHSMSLKLGKDENIFNGNCLENFKSHVLSVKMKVLLLKI